jgi:hypothetical protein
VRDDLERESRRRAQNEIKPQRSWLGIHPLDDGRSLRGQQVDYDPGMPDIGADEYVP